MAENITMTRANRIAVQTTEVGFKADYYRTHKHLATLWQGDTDWQADESANKSAQREDFRKYAIEHSADIGIEWNPADLRTEENRRVPKYDSDAILADDTIQLVHGDLWNLVSTCYPDLEWRGITADSITPMTHSAKGTDLSKLGILDGKYEKSGNWAWAEIEVILTLAKDGQEVYYITTCQLVSGQLKKPHITKTAFVEDIRKSLEEAGILPKEEPKAEESKQEEVEVVDEPKPKTKKSRSKKNSDK